MKLDESSIGELLSKHGISIANLNGLRGPIRCEPHAQIGGYVQFPPVRMGAFSFSQGGRINNTTIGRYCSIAPDVCIGAPSHPIDWVSTSPFQWNPNHLRSNRLGPMPKRHYDGTQSVVIGHDVWVGHGVVVRGGVTIGTGAIVGAGSVVTKDIQPYAVVGGCPARLIRFRFDEKTRQRLLESRWWRFAANDISGLSCDRVGDFLEEFEDRSPSFQSYTPGLMEIGREGDGFTMCWMEDPPDAGVGPSG